MSIIMGAMAGLGEGMQQTGKLFGDMALQEQAAQLAVQKERAILELKQQMEDAPLNRFGEAVKGKLSGTVAEPALAPGEKFNDRRYEDRTENPRTRPITRSEAMNSAANELLEKGDLKAYKAGKGIIGDKLMKIGEGDSLWDTETGKLVYQNMSKADREAMKEDRRDARQMEAEDRRDKRHQQTIAAMMARIAKTGGGDAGMTKAMMISIDRDILDLEKRIQSEEKIVRDIAAPKTEKDAAKERITALTEDKEFFRQQKYALMSDGNMPKMPERSTPKPDPKTSVVRTDNKPSTDSTARPPLSSFMTK